MSVMKVIYSEFFDDKADRIDELTKVYNRDVIFSYVELLISRNVPFSTCILDVDNFKYVNDGYGHKVGDRALYELSRRMEALVGDTGVVGRYGGDEFLIVIPEHTEYDDVWHIWHEMLTCTKNLKSKDLNELAMTVTMGTSRFPIDSTSIDDLFELADKALYRGKMKGRNCFIIYLKEKHANINLKTERDKVVSSTYIHSTIFNKLTQDDLRLGVSDAMNTVGSFFMIDHLSIATSNGLYFDYYHPICKKRGFKTLPDKIMKTYINNYSGIFYKNSFEDELSDRLKDLLVPLKEQGIYSAYWVEIKAHGKLFGYLRADIVENPSGRIWQNLDMDVLSGLAHTLALELYYRNTKIEELVKE